MIVLLVGGKYTMIQLTKNFCCPASFNLPSLLFQAHSNTYSPANFNLLSHQQNTQRQAVLSSSISELLHIVAEDFKLTSSSPMLCKKPSTHRCTHSLFLLTRSKQVVLRGKHLPQFDLSKSTNNWEALKWEAVDLSSTSLNQQTSGKHLTFVRPL